MTHTEVIRSIARKYYKAHGQNSWDHVNQVLANMTRIAAGVDGRELTLVEYSAGIFHDCSVHARQSKDHHGYWSAELADYALRCTGYFEDAELEVIHQAIVEHELLDKTDGPFSSPVGDLLASGDANPPDMPWILNKSWCWGISHGLSESERLRNIVTRMPSVYGSAAPTGYPSYYRRYYGERLKEMQKAFDNLTADVAYQLVFDYRNSHGLIGDEVRMPDPE